MSKQSVNRGAAPDDGNGDSLYDGTGKINANFSEIYTALGDGTTLGTYYDAAAVDALIAAEIDALNLGTMSQQTAADYSTTSQMNTAISNALAAYTPATQIDDTAYDATSWNAVTNRAPTKNAVRDQIETMLTSIAAKVGKVTTGVSGADGVDNVVSCTQAEYDGGTPNATTLYLITDA